MSKNSDRKEFNYTRNDAIYEFERLKNIALNSFDKNGNPNILAAIRAEMNKAKIAGFYKYSQNDLNEIEYQEMKNILIDTGELKFNVGESLLRNARRDFPN